MKTSKDNRKADMSGNKNELTLTKLLSLIFVSVLKGRKDEFGSLLWPGLIQEVELMSNLQQINSLTL